MRAPVLVTIPFSHYCEKARWALERAGVPFRESGHVPFASRVAGLRHGVWSSVPILATAEGTIADSTAILRWVDARTPVERRLFPEGQEAEVERWEALLDERLGPHTRRLAYAWVLDRRELVVDALRAGRVPGAERALTIAFYRPIRRIMKRGMRIDAAGVERSRARIGEVFAAVGEALAGGRRWLVGDRLTAADLTFAALAAPIVAPPEYGAPLPEVDRLDDDARRELAAWRASAAGAFALRVYAEARRAQRTAAPSAA